ncbi:MAG: protein-methionine-sulfoxide reductase catalytic subunit MsrP [Acidobacteriota bacterium]
MPNVLIPPSWRLDERHATPEATYVDRRRILQALGLGTLSLAMPSVAKTAGGDEGAMVRPALGSRFAERFPAKRNPAYGLGDRTVTDEVIASSHNNFYEFTTAKDQVWRLAQDYPVDPWKVKVHGLVEKPMTLDLDDLLGRFPLEERLYRFRCVERWSMQVPWTGFPLRTLIEYLKPLKAAKWVRFITVLDKKGLPGQRSASWYPWPYFEALRIDEATNDLAFAAVGIYGHALPMQFGAPWRVVAPWKYGYKSPKSVVEIEFTAERPGTFWNDTQPEEYGFFSNIEPQKPHPRWSQRFEQDIGTGATRETLLYNGYGEQVASMYDGSEI